MVPEEASAARPGRALLPLFPLGSVLVPGLAMPLHVFEPRYRALVRGLLARPENERVFGVVAIRDGHEVGVAGVRALHEVGCVAHVRQITALDDGRYDLLTTGARRFRLHDLVNDPRDGTPDGGVPYLVGSVEYLPEEDGEEPALAAAGVVRRFAAYRAVLQTMRGLELDPAPDLPDDPGVLSYLVATAMVLDLSERQTLLAAPDTTTRLLAESRLLAREVALAETLPSVPAGDLARGPVTLN